MSTEFNRLLKLLSERLETLPDKPEENAESSLKALWMAAAGIPISASRAAGVSLPALNSEECKVLDRLILQRLSGTPLAHITGRQMFMGIEFIVNRDALVPRRETEILARGAGEIVSKLVESQGTALVVDTCCGSGNVALALACRSPEIKVVGVDISVEAVKLACENAAVLEVGDRVEFRDGDLLGPVHDLKGKVDLLTCNPPYISTAKVESMDEEIAAHEPKLAFDGGPFGIKILGRLLKEAPLILRPGGYLAFEVGLGQGEPMMTRLEKVGGFTSIQPLMDQSENIRAITARKA